MGHLVDLGCAPTTTLVLWLIYASYLLLRKFADGPQMQTLAAVLAIFGYVDVPIVYYSTTWWRTQHPSPVIGGDGNSGLDPAMWIAVLVEPGCVAGVGNAAGRLAL